MSTASASIADIRTSFTGFASERKNIMMAPNIAWAMARPIISTQTRRRVSQS